MKYVVMIGLVMASACSVFADEPIDVNGIDDLLAKLRQYNGTSCTLRLAAGDYIMPAEPTTTNEVNQYGVSSILVDKLRLVGAGATPEATKLIGTGHHRVVFMQNAGVCENLMITNGNSTTQYSTYANSKRGGCVLGGGTLTNCVIVGGTAGTLGGGAGLVTLRNCTVTGNRAAFGGGVFNVKAYNTLICNNTSTSDGGGGYGNGSAIYADCVISNNTASGSGGGVGNAGTLFATNTLFIGNKSGTGGSCNGGGFAGTSSTGGTAAAIEADLKNHFWNCVFTNNFSYHLGGGVYRGTLHNCTVVDNMAESGGGTSCANAYDSRIRWNTAFHGEGGGSSNYYAQDCYMSNCVFFANTASNNAATVNGGAVSYGHLEDCEIHGNAVFDTPKGTESGVRTGCGVVCRAQLDRCDIHDNFSRYHGALKWCTARDCTLRNNLAEGDESHNAYQSDLIRCDISGGGTYIGSAVDSVFHDIGGSLTITTERNPLLPSDKVKAVGAISRCYGSFTNCLIRNNGTTSAPVALMFGHSSQYAPGPMVNCTIVSNYISDTFSTFKASRGTQIVENCVFADNFKNANTRSDISLSGIEAGTLEFTHSIYGVSSADLSEYSDGTLWKLGEGGLPAKPGFAHGKNPDHPYEPRASSPLVGRGQKEDWMETAFDIRGDGFPRLRDGKVDIGCYQSYLPAPGLCLSFR